MKNFILILFSIIALNSCDPKGVGGGSSDCDTIVKIRIDTVYLTDTVYHTIIDTVFIDKPIYIYDTIYKTDTIFNTIIEFDTINIIKVDTLRITDTIIKTEFVQKWDTVFVHKIDTILIDKIVRDTILINKVDTVEVVKPLPKTTIDTLVWGWARIKMNKTKQVQFTYRIDSLSFETFNLKTIDTTIYKCGISTDILKDTVQFNIRKFYEGNYFIKAEEIEIDTTFRIVEFAIREQDENKTYTQTYCNGTWNWSSRRANTIEELGDFIEVDYEHGTAENYESEDGVVYPVLYRNSHSFDTKYFEIKATSRVTGKSVTTGIIENPFM